MGSGARHRHAAREGSGMGDLKMADLMQVVLFMLAGTFLYGLVGYLFRDQITRMKSHAASRAAEK
jgi:hypothetical protein